MTGRILVFLVVITELQGQNIDSVVRNAVDAEFNRGGSGGTGIRGITRDRGRVTGGRTGSQLIPAEVTGSTADLPSGSGSAAINALNSFSMSNAPEMNRLLDDRSIRASTVARNIAASPAIASRTNTTEAFRRVVSDQQITASFRRAMEPFCYEIPRCNSLDPYRTADGSCNNLYDPLLGKSFTPQARVIQNAYDNFIDDPRIRTSDRRSFLPSARAVSNVMLSGSTPASSRFSTFLTHHGQFIDHDVISTPSMTEGNPPRGITDCCNPLVNKFACFPILMPHRDPFFPSGQTCMNMVRHAAALPLGCTNGVREQQNQRSSFIDGTAIYGFNKERELLLRQRSGGRLKESNQISGLLPRGNCPFASNSQFHCFLAGDHRQSETPTLTVMHITWLRRHNLIADALRTSTGITDDEVLFQEAKRIVVAELQHVTYTELLPAVLDDVHMRVFNLYSRSSGHDNVYNPNVDPRTFNAFGAAVLRMGHTLVRNIVGHDNGRTNVQTFPLSNHFGNPRLMFSPPNGYEFMARWMSKNAKSRSDSAIVDGLRNRLFEGPSGPFPRETTSLDLGAMNIQRGREHGLPSYNAYRQFCGRYPANYFAAVRGGLEDHTPQAAQRLASVYRSTHDIDLYAGGISEAPVTGGILGPTFSCLFAYQFSLYKHGDRFWYENSNFPSAFTRDQLAEIKGTTYAKILCSVVKNDFGSIRYQPRLLLRPEISGNYQRQCTDILDGNYLGFDIRPFANELNSIGGSRTSRSSPIHSFQGAFQRTSGGAARTNSISDTSRKPTNSGFQVPNPADVLRNVATNAGESPRDSGQPENTHTGRQNNDNRRQNQNRRNENRRDQNQNRRGQSQNRRGQNQNRRGQNQNRRGQNRDRRRKFQGRFGQTG